MDLMKKYLDFVKFDQSEIETRLNHLPAMLGFYQDLYYQVRRKHTKYSFELDSKWTEKYLYYKNEFRVALNNNETKSFVEKDLEFLEIKKKVTEVDDMLHQVEIILKGLDSMGWTLKNMIEWKKFQAGMYN